MVAWNPSGKVATPELLPHQNNPKKKNIKRQKETKTWNIGDALIHEREITVGLTLNTELEV